MELHVVAFDLTLFTLFLSTRGVSPRALPAASLESPQGRLNDQGHQGGQHLVVKNNQSVTPHNRKLPTLHKNVQGNITSSPILNFTGGVTPQSRSEDDTSHWNVENVVTSDNHLITWQPAVANNDDNNAPRSAVVGTTGVATTAPAPRQNNNPNDNQTRSQGQRDSHLKPRAGLLQPGDVQQHISLQQDKSANTSTSSDIVISGIVDITASGSSDAVTTSSPDDFALSHQGSSETNSEQWITAESNSEDAVSAQSTEDYTRLQTKDTSSQADSFTSDSTSHTTPGSILQSVPVTPRFSVRLEQEKTLEEFSNHSTTTVQIKTDSAQSALSTQPSLVVTTRLSSPAAGTQSVQRFPLDSSSNSTPDQDPSTTEKLQQSSTTAIFSTETQPEFVTGSSVQTPTGQSTVPDATRSTRGSGAVDNESDLEDTPGTTRPTPASSSSGTTTNLHAAGPDTSRPSSTTTMVYVLSSDVSSSGTSLFDGFDGLDGKSEFKVKDVLLGVSGTVGCMLTLCMLVAFTRCCCRKPKVKTHAQCTHTHCDTHTL